MLTAKSTCSRSLHGTSSRCDKKHLPPALVASQKHRQQTQRKGPRVTGTASPRACLRWVNFNATTLQLLSLLIFLFVVAGTVHGEKGIRSMCGYLSKKYVAQREASVRMCPPFAATQRLFLVVPFHSSFFTASMPTAAAGA